MARTPSHARFASIDYALEFLRLLWSIDHQLQRSSKRLTRDLGVTGPQRLAVRLIAAAPGLSPQEVAAWLHLHKSTVTGILQRLEQQGLISRSVDAADKRRARLRLTTRGRRISESRGPTIERAVQRALAASPEPSVKAARKVLAQIAVQLEDDDGPRRSRSTAPRQRAGGSAGFDRRTSSFRY